MTLAVTVVRGPVVVMYQHESIRKPLYAETKALSGPINSSLRDLLFVVS